MKQSLKKISTERIIKNKYLYLPFNHSINEYYFNHSRSPYYWRGLCAKVRMVHL